MEKFKLNKKKNFIRKKMTDNFCLLLVNHLRLTSDYYMKQKKQIISILNMHFLSIDVYSAKTNKKITRNAILFQVFNSTT